jgi:hypothetical protein
MDSEFKRQSENEVNDDVEPGQNESETVNPKK